MVCVLLVFRIDRLVRVMLMCLVSLDRVMFCFCSMWFRVMMIVIR